MLALNLIPGFPQYCPVKETEQKLLYEVTESKFILSVESVYLTQLSGVFVLNLNDQIRSYEFMRVRGHIARQFFRGSKI